MFIFFCRKCRLQWHGEGDPKLLLNSNKKELKEVGEVADTIGVIGFRVHLSNKDLNIAFFIVKGKKNRPKKPL